MGIAEGIDIRKMVEGPYSGPGHAIYVRFVFDYRYAGRRKRYHFCLLNHLRSEARPKIHKDLRRMTTRYMSSRDVCWTRAGQRGSQLPKSKRRCLSSTIL